MNDTLKVAGRIGAELGAAKAENERLRKALKRIIDRCEAFVDDEAEMRTPSVEVLMGIAEDAIYTLHEADAALSQQAEPVRSPGTEDSASMDSDVRQEPAPAQDEREAELWAVHAQGPDDLYAAFSREDAEQHAAALNALPMPEGIRVSAVVVPSPWSAAEHWKYAAELERDHATDLKAIATRPAQTEQQPAGVVLPPQCTDKSEHVKYRKGWNSCLSEVFRLNRAQTATQPEQSGKFAMHQRVRKTSGSEWQGRICGTYSTALTPEGYAVESEAHAGSVQIYPAKALEAVDE